MREVGCWDSTFFVKNTAENTAEVAKSFSFVHR
jgi:hypothetical protein